MSANGLDNGCREVVLKNEWGGRWTSALSHYKSHRHTYLRGGWTSFCQVNGIKPEDSVVFQLDGTGDKPVLRLCTAESSNRDKPTLQCRESSDDEHSTSSDNSSGDETSM